MNRLLDVFYIYQTNTNALEWTIIVLQWKELAVASRSFETIVLVVAGRSNSAVHYFVLLVITAVIAFAVAVFAMFRSNSPLRCFRRVHYFKFTFSFIFDDGNLCWFFRSLSLSLELFYRFEFARIDISARILFSFEFTLISNQFIQQKHCSPLFNAAI